jgi:MerR family transcriptional regulator, light-induced transcriptional regulator
MRSSPDQRSNLTPLTTFTPHDIDADYPRYTVSVVAQRVGVPTATLRSWNQRYGVGPLDHSPGRHRLYSDNDVLIVRRMYELITQGASPRSAAEAAIDSIRPARGDVPALMVAAFDLDVVTAGLLLDRHLRHFGVLDTWDELVCPAFASVETRQAEGVGCIDVEHMLSWTVSRSLQRLPIVPPGPTVSVILACVADEAHTLSLEALRAALGERGVGALMLGADTPTAALVDVVQRAKTPVTAVLWSQTKPTADGRTVSALAKHAKVLVAGPGWRSAPANTRLLSTLREAVDLLVAGTSR